MILIQSWPFFHDSFLGNLDQENMFYDVLERKNAILGFKNKNLKKPKNWNFPKGLLHDFNPRLAIF